MSPAPRLSPAVATPPVRRLPLPVSPAFAQLSRNYPLRSHS
jgi:hypothetical protein